MRLIAYAGTSTVLAAGVVLRAFHQRTNFYSACVYLSQSNACLMIITNLALVVVCLTMLGLQRLLYGPLRAFEIEQLYEKAWYAITETCVAMTIFRDEVGVWFLVMFVCLLIGKVWGWIGEGRVEILEQQPPANPRLFHARLSFSLLLSLAFDISLLRYNVQAVLRMTRPNMMVMFAFEFAILTLSSTSAAARYIISLIELHTVNKQRQLKMEERRVQLQAARSQTRNETGGEPDAAPAAPAGLEDIDETDIDVPGWEAKGQWVLSLDLAIDFLKLVVYLTFFLILLTLYGLPLHIMRDVFLTLRSFVRRIGDFIGYRRATRDMNERYRDALPEEIAREEICIICREEMRPWGPAGQNDGAQAREGAAGAQAPPATTTWDERSRPKRLPCGHILHFACLRRWLERQQICPTCRRPVIMDGRQAADAANQRRGENQGADPVGQAEPGQQAVAGAQPQQPGGPAGGQAGNRARVFNLGPLRIGFGVGTGQVLQDVVHRMQNGQGGPGQNDQQPEQHQQQRQQQQDQQHQQQQQQHHQHDAGNHAQVSFGFGFSRQPRVTQMPATAVPANPSAFAPHSPIDIELLRLENQVQQQIRHLRVTADQVRVVQAFQAELSRLRQMQDDASPGQPGAGSAASQSSGGSRRIAQLFAAPEGSDAAAAAVPVDGQAGLPPGLSVPPGWTFVPLYRTDGDRSSDEPPDVPGRSLAPDALFTTPTTTVSHAPVGHTSDAGSHTGPAHAPSVGPSAGNSSAVGFSFQDTNAGPSSSSQRPRPSVPSDREAPTQESTAFERRDLPSSTPKSATPWSFADSTSSAQADRRPGDDDDHHHHHRGEGTSENVVGDGRRGGGPSSNSAADDEPSSSSSAAVATSRVDKGKGRAVTVEDAPSDDID